MVEDYYFTKFIENYCPIKTKEGICRDGKECDHVLCLEKIHYNMIPGLLEQKMLKWRTYRRGEVRWKDEYLKKF